MNIESDSSLFLLGGCSVEVYDVETGVVRGNGKLRKFKGEMVEREVRLEGGVRLTVVGENES